MSSWAAVKARRVFAALKRIGWRHDRTVGSHKIMKKDGCADYPFSFHDSEELGPCHPCEDVKEDGPAAAGPVMALTAVLAGERSSVGRSHPAW